jgi:hypothetical protein
MSAAETTGIRAVARMLARLADGAQLKVPALAREEGIARSTAFAVVQHLEAAGMVRRDVGGALRVGPEAARLGYAALGLAQLQGPAEAVLCWLRDHTGATARLTCRGAEAVLLTVTASPSSAASRATLITEPLLDRAGRERAFLSLRMQRSATPADVTLATSHLQRAARTLERYLKVADT